MPETSPATSPRQPPGVDTQLLTIRAAVLRRMFWTVALLGGLVLLNIEFRLMASGQVGLGLTYLLAYAGILAFVALPQLPYAIRAGMPVAILFAVGTLEFWLDRLHSLGLMYYLAVVMIVGALFTARAAWAMVALCAVAIAAFGLLFNNGPYPFPLPEPRHSDTGLSWRAALLNFSMLALIGTALHEQLYRGLRSSVEASRIYLADLLRETGAREVVEGELREREERLRGIVEASRDWIWSIDTQGQHTYCNPAVEKILGYPVEELLSTSALEFIHEEDRKRVEDFLPKAVAAQRGWDNLLLRWRHKDGHYRYLESNAVAVLGRDGKLTGFQGVDRDVTDRIQANQALRESEERYRSLFEAANDAILLLEGTEIIDCNPCALNMFGGGREDLIGKTPHSLSPAWQPNGASAVESTQAYLDLARGGVPQFFEWQYRRFDSVPFDAEVSLNQLETGGREYVLAVVRDVSDRKQAEDALRHAEARSRAILYALPDSVFCLEPDGTYMDVLHRKASRDSDVPGTVGNPIFEILPPLVAGMYRKNLARTLNDNTMVKFEYDVPSAGSEWRSYEARMVPQERGIVLTIVRDITERKQTEVHLWRYQKQLEDLAARRSRELEQAQEELVRKEKLAALGTLTASVAHEIRNPLGTIRNAVFAVSRSVAKGEMKRIPRALELAETNIGRCDRIITELLDFSRKRQQQRSRIVIERWLADVIEEQPVPEGIVVDLKLDAGYEQEVDPEHLRQAVICVFNNGIQALQEDGAVGNRLTVYTAVTAGRVELRFEDWGPGISADIRNQVFEPLFSTKSFGVGLGVTIARDIMVEHGGGLEYLDRAGGGTIAILWLPAETGSDQAEAGEASAP